MRNNIDVFIAKKGALKLAVRHLQQSGVLIFPYDQHCNTQDKNGISLPFFGFAAGCYSSLAWLSLATTSPVVLMDIFYEKNTIVVELLKYIRESPQNTACFLTACNQALEKCILKHPVQWWWWHRRWKLSYDYAKQRFRD